MRLAWPIVLVLPAGAAEEDIRAAKPQVEIPVPEDPVNWAVWVGVLMAALIAVVALVRWLRSRGGPAPTAEEAARRALGELERRGGSMDPGDFAADASQVVRVFIERKFGLAAPKRTTEEFLQEMTSRTTPVIGERLGFLRDFLRSCDLAKFAGNDLDARGREQLVAGARAFVEAPDPVEPKEAA